MKTNSADILYNKRRW